MTLGYVNLPEAGEQVDRAGRRRVLAVDQARDDLETPAVFRPVAGREAAPSARGTCALFLRSQITSSWSQARLQPRERDQVASAISQENPFFCTRGPRR